PVPANERFGLGPFFRIEPLGMEYIAAALEFRGHHVTLADLRFTRSVAAQIRASRPNLVGVAAMHALETDEVVGLVRRVRALSPDEVPLAGRHHVASWRGEYACLAHRPAWLVETARGCPFRCSFCSIWQLHARAVRERSIDSVCRDVASVGDHIFIADDLFWHHASRSLELARELGRRGIRKRWILVQSG